VDEEEDVRSGGCGWNLEVGGSAVKRISVALVRSLKRPAPDRCTYRQAKKTTRNEKMITKKMLTRSEPRKKMKEIRAL